MLHTLRNPVLFAALLVAVGCSSNDPPDARIALPPLPPDAAVAAADAKLADGPKADGGGAAVDAAITTADAPPVSADAPIVETPDAAVEPVADAATAVDAATGGTPAVVVINEVSPNLTTKHDLIELLVTTGGSVNGFGLYEDATDADPAATLPNIQVTAGQLIVVHLVAAGTDAKTEVALDDCLHGAADCPGNYDGAWDVVGSASKDIGYSGHVLTLKNGSGGIVDAVSFMRANYTGSLAANFASDLKQVITDGVWHETCAEPCDSSTAGRANILAASVDWSDVGAESTGASIQRKAGGVNDHKRSDWKAVPTSAPFNTIGAPN